MNIIGEINLNSEHSIIVFRRHFFQMLIELQIPRPKAAQLSGLLSEYTHSFTHEALIELYLQPGQVIIILKNFTGNDAIFANAFHSFESNSNYTKISYNFAENILIDDAKQQLIKNLFLEKTVEELLLEVEEQNKTLAMHGHQLETKVQ